jgi:HAD superfamily hydrolase (TIGR01549 family)
LRQHDQHWTEELRRLGHPGAEPLDAGMEAAVYRLGAGRIAKVWGRRTSDELSRLQAFYDELAEESFSFRTPRILAVHTTQLGVCTIEEELPGTRLDRVVSGGSARLEPRVQGLFLDILDELSLVRAPAALDLVPYMDEQDPFRPTGQSWVDALVTLVERRVRRSDVLHAAVPDLDERAARVTSLLRAWAGDHHGVVHGDLNPGNVLVDEELRLTAVLDFGLLSLPGDPAFDAAVTAHVADMYGPEHLLVEQGYDAAVTRRFGHPQELLTLYRAAWALITSDLHDPQGRDGHFAWCAEMLQRNEVTGLLAGADAPGPLPLPRYTAPPAEAYRVAAGPELPDVPDIPAVPADGGAENHTTAIAPRAVLLDVGMTLVHPSGQLMLDLVHAEAPGHPVDARDCAAALVAAAEARHLPFPRGLSGDQKVGAAWGALLGLDQDTALRVWRRVLLRRDLYRDLDPDAVELLTGLRERGIAVAAVSNSDGSVRQLLRRFELDHFFDTVLDSAVLGTEKPAPEIFHAACSALGTRPDECWFVGDGPVNDLLGAWGAGIPASFLYDRYGIHTRLPGTRRIASLNDLLKRLP